MTTVYLFCWPSACLWTVCWPCFASDVVVKLVTPHNKRTTDPSYLKQSKHTTTDMNSQPHAVEIVECARVLFGWPPSARQPPLLPRRSRVPVRQVLALLQRPHFYQALACPLCRRRGSKISRRSQRRIYRGLVDPRVLDLNHAPILYMILESPI